MSTTGKVILVLIGGGLLVCLAVGVVGILLFRPVGSAVTNLLDNSEKSVRVGSEIAEYEIPAGFPDVFSTQIADCEMIGYTGSDGHSHIYFFQLPAGVTVDVSDMGSYLQKTFPDSADSTTNIRMVDTQAGTIAGQDVTLVIYEGTNHDGDPFREVSAVFQGKGGQAMVTFSRPTVAWDQAEVDRFLASIR